MLASAPISRVAGVWQRHSDSRFSDEALRGRVGNGRWGTQDGFPVLYLGRPRDSVVVEAYRHLVDPVVDPLPATAFAPRVLITVQVDVSEVIDLRTASGRMSAELTPTDLQSATTDRDAYARCREVAQIAHQLGRHGIIAPAATGIGETLVLFTDQLPVNERPIRSAGDQLWPTLPADPRRVPRLRLVLDEDG